MKIRKFFSFVVVTILLNLSVSVISNASVTTVNSPLAEPEVYNRQTSIGYEGQFYYVFYTSQTNDRQPANYTLNVLTYESTEKVNFYFYSNSRLISYPVADHPVSVKIYQYDVLTGNYLTLWAPNFTSAFTVNGNTYYRFGTSYYPNFSSSTEWNVYFVGDDTKYISSFNVSEPFVDWSQTPPEHNIYHSQLSEPVADEYNSYFICNDKLYWLSYKVNGLYSFQNQIEVESQTYVSTELYSGYGSGSYAGSQNGYSESFSLNGELGGSTGSGSVPSGFLGVWQSDPSQIDFVGVSQGSLHTNHNGTVTYNNVQVYPVAYNGSIVNRFFNACIYLDDNKTFYIRIYPNNDQMASLIVDMDIYLSTFELTDGSYISSSYTNYQGSVLYGGQKFELSEEIVSDVRCYGLQFKNVNNLPVNLSDVLWQYDLEFVQWRSAMLQTLQDIYQILNNGSGTPEAETYYDFAGELQSAEQNYSNLNAQDFNVMLDDALPAGKYDNAASQIKRWISDFSIGELIAVCVFALALGTVTLTLGKKKSD